MVEDERGRQHAVEERDLVHARDDVRLGGGLQRDDELARGLGVDLDARHGGQAPRGRPAGFSGRTWTTRLEMCASAAPAAITRPVRTSRRDGRSAALIGPPHTGPGGPVNM